MNEDPQTNIEKPPPVIPPRRIFPQITKEESDDRVRVVEELLLTESEFIKVIQNALLVFREPIDAKFSITEADISSLFHNLPKILEIHQELYFALEYHQEQMKKKEFVPVVQTLCSTLQRYMNAHFHYMVNHKMNLQNVHELVKANEEFFVVRRKDARCNNWDISAFLIKPVQRVCQYPLLLEKLYKLYPTDHQDYLQIQHAHELVTEIVAAINLKITKKERLQMLRSFLQSVKEPLELRQSVLVKEGSLQMIHVDQSVTNRYFVLVTEHLIEMKIMDQSEMRFKASYPLRYCQIIETTDTTVSCKNKRFSLRAGSSTKMQHWKNEIAACIQHCRKMKMPRRTPLSISDLVEHSTDGKIEAKWLSRIHSSNRSLHCTICAKELLESLVDRLLSIYLIPVQLACIELLDVLVTNCTAMQYLASNPAFQSNVFFWITQKKFHQIVVLQLLQLVNKFGDKFPSFSTLKQNLMSEGIEFPDLLIVNELPVKLENHQDLYQQYVKDHKLLVSILKELDTKEDVLQNRVVHYLVCTCKERQRIMLKWVAENEVKDTHLVNNMMQLNYDIYYTEQRYLHIIHSKSAYILAPFSEQEVVPLLPFSDSYLTDVKVGQKIGAGYFGDVYEGTWKGNKVALKKLNRAQEDEFWWEMGNELGNLSHPNLVAFFGVYKEDLEVYIVSEFCEASAISVLPTMTLADKLDLQKQIASALLYLFNNNIVHANIGLRNILVCRDNVGKFSAKVSDYGLAKYIQKEFYTTKNADLPFKWVAPEVFGTLQKFGKFSFTSDVWSFGILVWELMSNGKNPFIDVVEPSATVQYILATKLPRKPDNCSDVLWNIFWSFSRLLPHIF